MEKFLQILKYHQKYIYAGLLFLIALIVIVYIFPKEGKFRYEFQKGKPWLHENLIALYDFAIHKTDAELKAERDSLAYKTPNYYQFNNEIFIYHLNSLQKRFDYEWNRHFANIEIEKSEKDKYFNILKKQYEFIYTTGILEVVEAAENIRVNDFSFVVIKNNIAEDVDYQDVFTQKTAYEYLLDTINTLYPVVVKSEAIETNFKQQLLSEFVRRLDINEFIEPNIIFDKETTEKIKNNILQNISKSLGMVQKGEIVITKGEIVTDEKFKKLESLRREYVITHGSSAFQFIVIGQSILVFMLLLILYLFLYHFRKDILLGASKVSFILLVLILIVSLAVFANSFNNISLYLIPFAIIPIIMRTFFDSRLALFVHIVTVLLSGYLAPNGFEFVILQIITGSVAIFSLRKLHRRSQLFATSLIIFATYSFIYFGIAVIQEKNLDSINNTNFIWFLGNSLLLLTSYPLIYVFEKIFGFLSDVTLMELSDTNQPLLRKLAEKAPGTFQHSMQVANLAEEAVFQIGGNPLLVRAGALYHDIGKMMNPNFFTENQIGGINPHSDLSYDKSAEIVINHIAKGVELAKKYSLPQQIIDFITTHQGTTKTQYFYRMQKQKYPLQDIDDKLYTYPGPTPYSAETAVLMMADTVEAASRSLKTITAEGIDSLVEQLIDFQLTEKQFENATITFHDIAVVKEVFKKKLANIYHTRIEYPKAQK